MENIRNQVDENYICDCENGIHIIIENDYIPPDCEHNGYKGGKICKACEKIFERPVVIPATGHMPVTRPRIEPTCTRCGFEEAVYCENCGKLLSGGKTIPPTGHTDSDADGICDGCGQRLFESKQRYLIRVLHSIVKNH